MEFWIGGIFLMTEKIGIDNPTPELGRYLQAIEHLLNIIKDKGVQNRLMREFREVKRLGFSRNRWSVLSSIVIDYGNRTLLVDERKAAIEAHEFISGEIRVSPK